MSIEREWEGCLPLLVYFLEGFLSGQALEEREIRSTQKRLHFCLKKKERRITGREVPRGVAFIADMLS